MVKSNSIEKQKVNTIRSMYILQLKLYIARQIFNTL